MDLTPIVHGSLLYHKGDHSFKKQKMRYVVLRPCLFDIVVAPSKEQYEKAVRDGLLDSSTTAARMKGFDKIDLRTDVMSAFASFHAELI